MCSRRLLPPPLPSPFFPFLPSHSLERSLSFPERLHRRAAVRTVERRDCTWSVLRLLFLPFIRSKIDEGRREGDKQNHVATLHVPQVYYFIAFAGVFCAPRVLSLRKVRRAVGGLVVSWRCVFSPAFFRSVFCKANGGTDPGFCNRTGGPR
jgi:hypothetical protein